jgi:hypothetical protein
MKTQIDNSKFHLENNPESFERYKKDLSHYNNQCRIVLEQMLTGRKLTTMTAMSLGIGDLRRRCKDLRDLHNIPVISRYMDGSRFKEYYLPKSFIEKF